MRAPLALGRAPAFWPAVGFIQIRSRGWRGVGALVRNLAAAITAGLLWVALVEGIVSQLLGGLGRWLPFAAGQALANMAPSSTSPPQWAAGLVLLAYAVVFATLAVATTVRRDVTWYRVGRRLPRCCSWG